MKYADLHLHTVFSDGTSTPEEIILESKRRGLSAISIVDHDTVDGIEASLEIGREADIEVLPGIELTAEYEGTEVHVLGYLIDYKNMALAERTDVLRNNRIERIYKIVSKLNGLGINLDAEAVFDIAKQGTVGRLHVARAMVKKGFVSSVWEAFNKYIGEKCPAYVCNFKLSPREVSDLIKSFGGIPVLAHPYILNKDDLIIKFINDGIMGLEIYYPEHKPAMVKVYLGLAKKYNLLVTGGSDYHGDVKPEVKIGSAKIVYELVEKLKEAKQLVQK